MTDRPALSPAATLIREGRLGDARDALLARVKAAPADPRARLDLAELLIVLGDYERADNHADVASTLDPSIALPTALTRQLIRAATWRRETFEQRRAPDLVTEPDAATTAAVARLAGVAPDTADPPEVPFTLDGRPIADLRDLDDRTATVLEVLTSTGNYVWVPFTAIVSLKIARPERLRDVVWRQAELDVRGGPNGVVYLPAIYHASAAEQSDDHRLGRATDWIEDGDTARGLGLRTFLAGEDALALDEIAELDAA
ncbi:type VI secretion system accessory protein TagJ [Sphingomonas montana]|uniref:type VI secretion system accessory protein TagJ n=1 Tax=Sphingomonas montana TaxID=1843236 RepID=UPI00096D5D79|nr:type VI secretion system accessory protein TagJ [Sphingomonas montana]